MLFLIFALITKSQIKSIIANLFITGCWGKADIRNPLLSCIPFPEGEVNKMIEHISELLANVMLNNKIISKSEYNWKKYGIELFLIQTGCIISSVLFCTLLGRTLECVLLLLFIESNRYTVQRSNTLLFP